MVTRESFATRRELAVSGAEIVFRHTRFLLPGASLAGKRGKNETKSQSRRLGTPARDTGTEPEPPKMTILRNPKST